MSESEARKSPILIIGGFGYLGSHIQDLVTPDSRFSSHIIYRNGLPLGGALPHQATTYDEFVESSAATAALVRCCRAAIYVATTSVPSTNDARPWLELIDNVAPALRAFDVLGRFNSGMRLVLVSSGGAVYGEGNNTPFVEDDPLRPQSAYGHGKVLIEQSLAYSADRYSMRYTILRAANPVGRYQRKGDNGLAAAAVRAIKTGIPLSIYGDGKNVRDYFDADDLAEAALLAASDETQMNRIWNVSSGLGRSILEVVEKVESVIGTRVPVNFRPARSTDLKRVVLDPTRIRAEAGWFAKTKLERSISSLWSENL